MKSKPHTRRHLVSVVTQQLIAPDLAKDQITGIPVLVGIAMGLCAIIPPYSRAKLYVVLGVEAASIVWARLLYVLWRRRIPTNTNDSTQVYAWTQSSTLLYHLARGTMFFPFSLGMLAVSLLILSLLQIRSIQILLSAGYGVTTLILYMNRYWLLEMSVVGIRSKIWERLSSCIVPIGLGLVGVGITVATLISRLAPKSVGLGIMVACSSALALMMLGYSCLEFSIVQAFFAKSIWRRK